MAIPDWVEPTPVYTAPRAASNAIPDWVEPTPVYTAPRAASNAIPDWVEPTPVRAEHPMGEAEFPLDADSVTRVADWALRTIPRIHSTLSQRTEEARKTIARRFWAQEADMLETLAMIDIAENLGLLPKSFADEWRTHLPRYLPQAAVIESEREHRTSVSQ